MIDNQELAKAIAIAEDLAQNGTKEEKDAFVEWCFFMVGYNSAQASIGNKEAREAVYVVKKQYEAYIKALK